MVIMFLPSHKHEEDEYVKGWHAVKINPLSSNINNDIYFF